MTLPATPPDAKKLFENKEFNRVKREMPHLSAAEISEYLLVMWKGKTTKEVREGFKAQAAAEQEAYFQRVKEINKMKSEIKQQIHDIKYS